MAMSVKKQVEESEWFQGRLSKELTDLMKLSPSRERALAITRLQKAIMWLGEDGRTRLADFTKRYLATVREGER